MCLIKVVNRLKVRNTFNALNQAFNFCHLYSTVFVLQAPVQRIPIELKIQINSRQEGLSETFSTLHNRSVNKTQD